MMFIVKVPGVNGNPGCEQTGNAIIASLRDVSRNFIDALDLEEIHLNNSNLDITNQLIYENSFEAFVEKPRIIFLGGDHSISYSTTRAFLDYCQNSGKEPCLIVFDSHANLKDSKKNPKDDEWLNALIKSGFPIENILLVGVEDVSKEEANFIQKNKIKIVNMNSILLDIENSCETIMEFVDGRELYLSIDINVVDSAFAPATKHNNSGGLTSRQLIYLIQRTNKIKTLRAIDIVGINEKLDREKFGGVTIKFGAKILSEFLQVKI